MVLFSLIPAAWRPYAKSIVASIGLILSAIVVAIPDSPKWAPVALALLTALGVYGQANGSVDDIPTGDVG